MKARKIVVYHLNKDLSGSSVILDSVIDVLKSNNFLVKVIYANRLPYLKYSIIEQPILRNIKFLFWQFFSFTKVFFRFDRAEFVIVNTGLSMGAILGWHVTPFRQKFLLYSHETHVNNRLIDICMKRIISSTRPPMITVSSYHHLFWKEKYGVNSFVIPNPVKEVGFLDKGVERRFVTFVGNPSELKGYPVWLQVVEKLNTFDIPSHTVLNRQAHIYPNLIKDKNKLSVGRRDLTEIYLESKVVVNLTNETLAIETFSLVIAEAILHGCGVVTPRNGGFKDYISESDDVRMVNTTDVSAVLSAIIELYSIRSLDLKQATKKLQMNAESFDKQILNVLNRIN